MNTPSTISGDMTTRSAPCALRPYGTWKSKRSRPAGFAIPRAGRGDRGLIRWLRPEYQAKGAAVPVATQAALIQAETKTEVKPEEKKILVDFSEFLNTKRKLAE